MIAEAIKVVAAKLDYELTLAITGDAITTGAWTVSSGVIKESEAFTATAARVRISGGTAGERYVCRAHVVRASGQEEDHALVLFVVARVMVADFVKRPSAILDYVFDWSAYVSGDPIATHSQSAAGLTIVGASNAATVRLSGGAAGGDYYATDHIVTTSGQIDERSILVHVRDVL